MKSVKHATKRVCVIKVLTKVKKIVGI